MNVLRSRFFQAVVIFVAGVPRPALRDPAARAVERALALHVHHRCWRCSSSSRRTRLVARVRRSRSGSTLTEPRYRPLRSVIVVAVPLLLGLLRLLAGRRATPQAPPELRAVHPAPPASIQFRGKEINIAGVDNPLRKDPGGAARSTRRPAARSTSGTACTATATTWTARATSPTASIRRRPNFVGPGHHRPARRRPICSGASPRAGRACRRNRRPGTRSCRPGRIGSPRSRSGRSSSTSTRPPGSSRAGWESHAALVARAGPSPWLLVLRRRLPPRLRAQRRCHAGKAVYEHSALGCHGDEGRRQGPGGRAPAAPAPRLHAGLYKIRTTANKIADRPGPVPDHHRRDAGDLHAAVGGSP